MIHKKELKIKAKIADIKKIREKVRKIATFLREEGITDYFFNSDKNGHELEFRLKKLKNLKVISLKIISNMEKMYENDEYSFNVDKVDDFVDFLEKLGFKPSCLIHRLSEIYVHDGMEIEISYVKELGNFIELTLYKGFNETNKKKLMFLTKRLGLEGSIEPKSYLSLMMDDKTV